VYYVFGGIMVGVFLWWGSSVYLEKNSRNIYLAWIPILFLAIIFVGHNYYLSNYPSNTVGSVPPDFILNPPDYSSNLENWENTFQKNHPLIELFLSSPFGIGVLCGPLVVGFGKFLFSRL